MQLSQTRAAISAVFDDPNLVSSAGLLPVLALADSAGLRDLADQHLSVPTDKGANAGLKVASLVLGMVAGADSIDDMALLRHGGMGRVFKNAYAPSTLGSFLRAFTFGHVRQRNTLAARSGAHRCPHTVIAARSDLGRLFNDGRWIRVNDVEGALQDVTALVRASEPHASGSSGVWTMTALTDPVLSEAATE